jgi:hypothetical protein
VYLVSVFNNANCVVDLNRLQEIYLSVAMAWVNCSEYNDMAALKTELRSTIQYLERVFFKDGQESDAARWWISEKERVAKESSPWIDMLRE